MATKKIDERKQARDKLYEKLDQEKLSLAEAVKLIREIYGLTQSEYAKKVNVSKMTITNLEQGKGNPTLKSIEKILSPMKLELKLSRQN